MGLHVYDMRCEYRRNPLGLDDRKPRISWKLSSGARGLMQTAYRIQVAAESRFDHPIWDTGIVSSDHSVLVPYEGAELASRTRYYYRVRVWDNAERESEWSETAYWETALLDSEDWKASWIAPDREDEELPEEIDYLRKEFRSRETLTSARIYATALGVYKLYVNGQPADDAVLTPGWTSYRKRLQYQTFDVTELIQEENNAIGVMLGNGWYAGDLGWMDGRRFYGNRRALLLQLHLTYEDGSEEIVRSDESWTSGSGALRMSELYHGEVYDARLEQDDWHRPGFSARGWRSVRLTNELHGTLVAQQGEPVRIIQQLEPASIFTTPRGEVVLDIGQNLVGWMRFKIESDAGKTIIVRHAEVLDADGNFHTANLRTAKQTIHYICKGGGEETYEPIFSFQGFRYVHVEGLTAEEAAGRFTACVLHTDMEHTGAFRSSDPLLNQLQSNIVWGQKGNFLEVPTDCPQRDERLGWTGDAQAFVRTAAYNFNVAPFFAKWLKDLAADQRPDGGVPHVVPDLPFCGYDSSAWSDAAVIVPWTMYLCYGDKRLLETQYESMRSWVEFIRAQGSDEYLWNTGFHFGDWLALDGPGDQVAGATTKELIATAFYAYSTGLLAEAAEALGKSDDLRTYANLRTKIGEAFRREFVTPSGRVACPTQTAYALALMFDLLEEKDRPRTAQMLADHIRESGEQLTTGFIGTPYLCHVLTRFGYNDLAYRLALRREYPSWLYSVTQGATTIWEHWDGIKQDGSFWKDEMNSFNHYAFGAIGDWLYRVVAGIDTDPSGPGYKKIVIKPQIGEGLTEAEAVYQSLYGEIRSAWLLETGDRMQVVVKVPPNTTAEVWLPNAEPESIRESGLTIERVEGILTVDSIETDVRLVIGSGTYLFKFDRVSN
ncbi:glycoside hydrolase family 78 protein [Cohnella herbarum]|uniref:alpha-L-rhamnosidase n=1 Tax=Cohnella herbarum TaxID=2728023 RepID=A0A7Z2ZKH5_9BACL|nr:glycoside hydrolase family 78 protein [Cohnella herbarum]QJD82789.1 family 78 glycoside hydrolase catalytic domain [Cohnella herbarum]